MSDVTEGLPRIRELLATNAHRPYPLPDGPWVMFQRWHELLFAHWPLAPEDLRPRIPAGLELDTFDGRAWLGVVPFRMSRVRLRGSPALPGVSSFPELNVRTYVRRGERRGVWFFSLDAASRMAVRAARAWFKLPYHLARMDCVERSGEVAYRSQRVQRGEPPAEFVGRYAPTAPVELARPGSLEEFLSERYCLFAARGGRLLRGDIHHRPWPLQRAEARIERDTMARACGLPLPDLPPLLHFARVLDVLIWPPVRA